MKTIEEIAKELYPYSIFTDIDGDSYDSNRLKREAYIKGYEACNDEWEEKLRWKSTKTEPPTIGKRVELSGNFIGIDNMTIADENDLKYVITMYSHWREIIE